MLPALDLSRAVAYHYDAFPPGNIDYARLVPMISQATFALARYDQVLKTLHNSDFLLTPLRSQEAVVSSRMEGTISTLEDVLRFEAEDEGGSAAEMKSGRNDTLEVALYARALKASQSALRDGYPLSDHVVRSTHRALLEYGRGAAFNPGGYKTEQNYLVDRGSRRVTFVPISPERLNDGLQALFSFINADAGEILSRTALAHVEFEALHPFKDGNGRIGRMLIPLMLWKAGAISEPHFYVSQFFEERKDEYVDLMRNVSASGAWTEWVDFFLEGVATQANRNLATAEAIRNLYETMKDRFREALGSQWSTIALDFMFTRPVFRNAVFTTTAGIPTQTAHRFARTLVAQRMLAVVRPASGPRSAIYAFEPLLALVRG